MKPGEGTGPPAPLGTNVLGMSENPARSVTVERTGTGHFVATNTRGGTISFGTGSDSEFTPSNCSSPRSAAARRWTSTWPPAVTPNPRRSPSR